MTGHTFTPDEIAAVRRAQADARALLAHVRRTIIALCYVEIAEMDWELRAWAEELDGARGDVLAVAA